MKPLDPRQRAFKADEITYLDRKSILLDRMLLNLFELLRFDGRQAIRRRRRSVDLPSLVKLMETSDRFVGFDTRPDIAEAWLSGDLLEIMNRDKPGRETVVGPRPFHLNAFKLANPKAVADYGASMQVWAMLFHADRPLLSRLKEFFGRGLDPALDRYDKSTSLDLETLAVLGLVDQVSVNHATTPAPDPIKPLCLGQGRLMAEDLRKLLAYEESVPRHVLANYVRTILGLHLTLLVLRLLKLLPDWVSRATRGESSPACAIDDVVSDDASACPYSLEIVVDLTDDPASSTAALSRASLTSHFDRISPYVRAVILLNRVKDFATVQAAAGKCEPPRTVTDLLRLLSDPPSEMDGFFTARIADVLTQGPDEEEEPIVTSILHLTGLSQLDKYVELVCLQRMRNERSKMIHLTDSLGQKNKPGGFLRQTAGARAPRWFVLGSHLLETLVQISVLGSDNSGRLESKPVLLNDFSEWLRQRYGFVIYAPAFKVVPPEEQDAWRRNEQALRERLHQIGFFTDLSDAFNSQTLRPRYKVAFDA